MAEQDLELYVAAPSPTASLISGRIHGYQDFQRIITYHRLHREFPLRNNIYAFNASRTRFFPYQFKPLIKLLDSARHRLLICDEVGLGKTIEAGLILVELRARQSLKTVLVVCPAGLREKWKLELRRRFGEDFKILSARDVNDFLDDYEERPDQVTLDGVVSYETLRSSGTLERVEEVLPSLDLVVADEAHHMRNMGVRTRRVGVALAAGAGALILLTATPVHLGDQNLFSLLNLLDEEDFPDLGLSQQRFRQNEPLVRAQRLLGRVPPAAASAAEALQEAAQYPWFAQAPTVGRVAEDLRDLARLAPGDAALRSRTVALQRDLADLNLLSHIFTRTRKRDVHIDLAQRRAFALEVTLTPPERAFYNAVSALVRARAASSQYSVVLQWQLNNIQRRAASSIHALAQLFRERPAEQGLLGGDDDELPEDLDNGPEGNLLLAAMSEVHRLASNWDPKATDSKYAEVWKLLQRLSEEGPGHKLVIFAFYRETLRYLDRRLRDDGIVTVLLDGGVTPEDRPPLIAKFREDPAVQVLLSSRVGSEGLDFQFCDTMINYDLPWNPMEVEQRIGRLDRIGQHSPIVRIYNLWTLDTIEERILRRLYERIGVFERSIGALDAVLGETIKALEREATSRELSAEEAQQEAERVAQALERATGDSERLESETSRFIGADEYFADEVSAIQANRRYVTGEQLLRFVIDFLKVHAPGTRLRYDSEKKIGTLSPDPVLQKFMRGQKNVGDLIPLLAAPADGLPVTFDAQVAFEEPRVEFINVLHPLVVAIVTSYVEAVGDRVSAQHIVLRTSKLPPGPYVFVVYRLSVHGARGRHTMECVLLNDDLELACDPEVAEAVLGEMVELGEDGKTGGWSLEPQVAEAAVRTAETLFLARRQELRQRLEAENDEFVARRMASLRQSFEKNIGRVQDRLSKAQTGGKQERYQRMLRGQLARLEGEKQARLTALESLRSLQVEHTEITAGLLEVPSE